MTTKYIYSFSEGNKGESDLLGGKGANLAEMTRIGIPVPPGFTITTEACKQYLFKQEVPFDLELELTKAIRELEDDIQKRLGDKDNPLLVSVRSGAKYSMPGMMDTVLNVGLNDLSVQGLAKQTNNPRFAWDAYRRLLQMFGKTVLNIDGSLFSNELEKSKKSLNLNYDYEIPESALQELVIRYKQIIRNETGSDFPQSPREQLDLSIRAVFDSWNTERAKLYRRRERIPDDLGTAVNVVTMVFGNMGDDSGTGVCFTRNPATGAHGSYGDYLQNAQGEDVVSGIRNTSSLETLRELAPQVFQQLQEIMYKLETHYRDMCDIEFTIERGTLYILQTRIGKRTASAAFRIATQLVDEQVITMDEALLRVDGKQLAQLMFPQFNRELTPKAIAIGIPASPGAAVGKAVFSSERAREWASRGEKVILIRRETNPDDLGGMIAAVGILTSRGGKTSHAAVVARGMGKTAICGAEELNVHEDERYATVNGHTIKEGDYLAIDGTSGEVFFGEVQVVPSNIVKYFLDGIAATSNQEDTRDQELIRAVDRFLRHADRRKKLKIRVNADNETDANIARRFGAQGIGLCRTEHMFLGDRRVLIERVILAKSEEERIAALAALQPLQRADFAKILEEMDGLPTTIRLLDPPLHEFLPDLSELKVKVALNQERKIPNEEDESLLRAVEQMHESNPMLGLRGVRLGLISPGLYELQVRAIADAMADLIDKGKNPIVEIMIPLVGSHMELRLTRNAAEKIIQQVAKERKMDLPIEIGTMIELPRAALTANRIGKVADFFSFGTNDLTQTTWGFSRDDVEAEFFSRYFELGIFTISPFETIDEFGVGELVKIAAERGRQVNPKLHLGVCGEQGGDPESIHFFHNIGLDYVSCSPFRVPIARLEAGRASVINPESIIDATK